MGADGQAMADPAALHSASPVPNVAVKSMATEMCELADSSIILADWGGGPAQQVWLDGARTAQALGADTAGASAVVAVDKGHLIVHWSGGWVARTGSVAWRTTRRISWPYTAVVVGHTALVSCTGCDGDGAAQVVRLDMQSGDVTGSFGKGVLKYPRGVAVGPDGIIHVADYSAGVVQVLQLFVWNVSCNAIVFSTSFFKHILTSPHNNNILFFLYFISHLLFSIPAAVEVAWVCSSV